MPSSTDVASDVVRDVAGKTSGVKVSRFVLKGVIEREENGITLAHLETLIANKRAELPDRLNVADIHHVADHLTGFYQAAGFPFSRVIVPEQEVIGGIVTLEVVEAVVGSVDIITPHTTLQAVASPLYSTAQLSSPFSPVMGAVVDSKSIESILRRVNSFPGLTVFGYFSRGAKPGETRINLKVQGEEAWQLLTKVDNYGTDTTGQYRGLVLLTTNNPFGFADQLSLGLLQSFDVDNDSGNDSSNASNNASNKQNQNTTYGSLSYRTPLFHSAISLGFLFSNNQFDIGREFSDLGLEGEASIARVDSRYQWSRTPSLNSTAALYADRKTSELNSGLTTDILDKKDVSTGVGALLTLNYRSVGSAFQQQLLVEAYSGQYKTEFGEDALLSSLEESFVKTQLRYRLKWDWKQAYSQLELSFRAQFSDVALPSMEKISVSGPYGVRALETGFYSADKGAIASMQWRLMDPSWLGSNEFLKTISKAMVPFVFYDAGLMENILSEEERLSASGYGLGIDYNVKITSTVRAFGRLTIATTDHIEQRNTETDAVNMTIDAKQQRTLYGEFNVRF